MSLTEERAQASAATPTSTDVASTPPTRKSWRRPSRKVLFAAAVTVGVLVGATGGYVVYRTSPDPQERSRVSVESGSDQHLANLSNQIQSRRSLDAQSARWQAQADAYLAEQQAHLEGQAKTHGATASTNPIDVGDQAARAERFDRKAHLEGQSRIYGNADPDDEPSSHDEFVPGSRHMPMR